MAAPIIDTLTPGAYQLLIKFDQAIVLLAPALDPANYLIVPDPVGLNAVSVYISAVDSTDNADELLLTTSDYTAGETYRLTITAGAVENALGQGIVAPGNTDTFVAVTVDPIVQQIYAIDDRTIRVVFSKEMSRVDIDNPTKYSFDNGLSVISVTIISNSIVELTTSKQTPSVLYTLEIVP